ncbi:complex I subunit 4 family protein [Lacimicrobium alkaliphilum]|uniref:NADH-quinone oxidoreductase subunit M n=1 Tax=Lacimicrobium alkaliphilum TaxID=1526571 RepID=A0ABQ1R6V0_9ALTE|nr:NADH-quinone oxidoreductase subunit M [Lacimicrobium alkaliphilum]GGD60477.1 NADH-quinone oxidoreductase subunit M [Lacimicrobium alkaliphilum]
MVALSSLIWCPVLLGILSWLAERRLRGAGNWVTLGALVLLLFVSFYLGAMGDSFVSLSWFSRFNIHFTLFYDGLAQLMVVMTLLLAMLALLVSWREIDRRHGFFHFNLMFSVAGINGVFLAADLFLFFLCWEAMLLPMTALILIWGHENRRYAAIKFFIFTQVSGLLMLLSIIALALFHQHSQGSLSFSLNELQYLDLPIDVQFWLMLGFFIAFAVKLPSVPFHTWLPDAHTQAPTAGSVLLAGILLKTGAYGLIRVLLPLFPEAAMSFAPVAVTLGVISIVYGALMAFSQTDFKRLVAYSSISHMGFILLALFSWQAIALQGAVLVMVAHGISSAGLFCVAGMLQHRLQSRELGEMGGLWASAPRMATVTLVFVMAGIGLPGLANFNGEFLSLLGSFAVYPLHAVAATLAIVGSALYGLRLFQRTFQGPVHTEVEDLQGRELLFCGLLVLALVYFGVQPHLILEASAASLDKLSALASFSEVRP